MNKNIFISNIEVKELPLNFKNKYQLEIKLFDKNYNEELFKTSLMSEEKIKEYKANLFKVLNAVSKLQVLHNPQIKSFSLISDDNNNVVGLELEDGLVLKNEIKFI